VKRPLERPNHKWEHNILDQTISFSGRTLLHGVSRSDAGYMKIMTLKCQ